MKKKLPLSLIFAVVVGIASNGYGQILEQIVVDQEARLEEGLERLRGVRTTIQAERLPVIQELHRLEAQAAELEAEVKRTRRDRDSQSVELETLRSRVEVSQKEVEYVSRSLMPGYLSSYEAAISAGKRETVGEDLRKYNLFLENPDASDLEKLDQGLGLIGDSLAQVNELLGGQRYPGKAITPDGTNVPGEFIQIGPLLYFATENSALAGPVESTRALDARVHPLGTEAAASIAQVAKTGEGNLPVDLSLGDALALARTRDTVMEHLVKGGVWVIPILSFALIATLVAVFKSVQVFRIRQPQPVVIHGIVKSIRDGKIEEARKTAAAQPQPTREMLIAAVNHADESTEMVEEVMYESMLTTQPQLERFLNVIAVTAAAAPLLGLLGTVTGIIKTFGLMTIFGAGDPRPLISGISEALITTELGLIVAIPALVMHALLSRKVAGTMARMEKTAVTFVNGLSRTRPMTPGGIR